MKSNGVDFDYQASCRRICSTYRRDNDDRIPIFSPIPWSPCDDDIETAQLDDWRDTEDFRRVARLVQKHCDLQPPYNLIDSPWIFERQGYQRFREASQEYIETPQPEQISDIRTRYTEILHTPKGDLKWIYEKDKGVFTSWDRHKPIQCVDDVEKMLSVPYKFTPPDASEFDAFRKHRAEMRENAVSGSYVNSMVAMLCGVMSYELMLEWI